MFSTGMSAQCVSWLNTLDFRPVGPGNERVANWTCHHAFSIPIPATGRSGFSSTRAKACRRCIGHFTCTLWPAELILRVLNADQLPRGLNHFMGPFRFGAACMAAEV